MQPYRTAVQRWRRASWVLGLALLTGCAQVRSAPTSPFATGGSGPEPVLIEVSNGNPADMVIRADLGGVVVRLGAVDTGATRRFQLPPSTSMPSTLLLIADPIGSEQGIRSWVFSVDRGQRVLWKVGVNATTSALEVRSNAAM